MKKYFVTTLLKQEGVGFPFQGEPLARSKSRGSLVEAADPLEAAEKSFALYNRDDRPNRHTERSMCVGDVVRVKLSGMLGEKDDISYFACDTVGWSELTEPQVGPHITNKVDAQVCCARAEIRGCVCAISYVCPDHGSRCVGSHD